MAQAPASLSINDGTATPVAVVFTTTKASPVLSVFKDKRLGKVSYWPEITLSSDIPGSNAVLRKPELRFAYPIVDPVTGVVTDVMRARLAFDIPMSAAQTDVNHMYAFVKNGTSHALIQAAIRDLDTVIG